MVNDVENRVSLMGCPHKHVLQQTFEQRTAVLREDEFGLDYLFEELALVSAPKRVSFEVKLVEEDAKRPDIGTFGRVLLL